MYDDFENKKLIINYNPEGILLSDGHERTKLIDTQEQLFNILHTGKHNFSEQEIKEMKNHLGIDKQTCINKILEHELTEFKTSRSGGHGGQNVNKVETKVQLFFHIQESKYLDQEQKDAMIANAHPSKLHHDNSVIEFECDEERNQAKNKEKVIKKFIQFMTKALEEKEERIETELPGHVKEKRLDEKKKHGKKKSNRTFKPELD